MISRCRAATISKKKLPHRCRAAMGWKKSYRAAAAMEFKKMFYFPSL
jgi:hypothetical protein